MYGIDIFQLFQTTIHAVTANGRIALRITIARRVCHVVVKATIQFHSLTRVEVAIVEPN